MWAVGIGIVCIVQTSVIETVPSLSHIVNVPLIGALVFAIVRRSMVALLLAGITGAILDLYSALPFGVFTTTLICAVVVMQFMQRRVLKNFALHAVVVNTIVALLLYHVVFVLCVTVFRRLQFVALSAFSIAEYSTTALTHIGVQTVAIVICFYIAQLLLRYAGRTTLHV